MDYRTRDNILRNVDYILGTLSKYEIPSNAGLDTVKTRDFMGNANQTEKIIISSTTKIDTADVMKMLWENLNIFLGSINEEFSILIDSRHIGFELYFLSKTNVTRSKHFRGFCDFRKCNTRTILFVSDSCLTGTHTISMIDGLAYACKRNFKIHMITPIFTRNSLTTIRNYSDIDSMVGIVTYKYMIVKTISEILKLEIKDPIRWNSQIERETGSIGDPSPVFFEYRVPDKFSSFPGIYLRRYKGTLFSQVPSLPFLRQLEEEIDLFK